MKKTVKAVILLLLAVSVLQLTGCWNYREIDKVSIVAGAAIDKERDRYVVTVEVIDMKSGKESVVESKIIEGRGQSIFDAVRNIIQISGKRLYWAHSKILIISQEIAREGVADVIDFYARDSEPRFALYLLISKEETAKDIFLMESFAEDIKSFDIEDMLSSEESVLKVSGIVLYEFINDLGAEGKSATLPSISLILNNDQKRPELSGEAVFKKDRLIGFLDGKESKILHYILDETQGGLLVGEEISQDVDKELTLEVFENGTTTKIKPEYVSGDLTINIEVDITAAIAENRGGNYFVTKESVDQMKKEVEKAMEEKIKNLILKVQSEYGSDIFGFGRTVKADMPKTWKKIKNNWGDIFENLEVKVTVDFKIVNKAMLSQPITIGD